MIGRKNLHVTAERANFPLGALYVRAGSAANVALFDVPVRGGVDVTAVTMRVTNVDGVGADFAAVRVGATWVVDVPASHLASVGTVVDGVEVWATGKGADGETHDWNIGVGDLCVLASDAAPPVPGETLCVVRLRDAAPTSPIRGDAYITGATLNLYDGSAWVAIGGSADDVVTRTGTNPVKSSGIWGAIWGALTALPTGFASLYDWCVAQLAGKFSTSGGTMTGTLNVGDTPDATVITPAGGVTTPRLDARAANISGVDIDAIGAGSVLEFKQLNATTGAVLVPLPAADAQPKTVAFVGDVASAADLRYRIAEAELTAKLPEGVTAQWDGVAVPSPELVSFDGGDFVFVIRDAGGGIEYTPCEWTNAGVVVLSRWDERLAFFDSEDQALATPPDLVVVHVLSDRTVNRITASDETSIDIELPAPVEEPTDVRRARDFILDVDNSANAGDLTLEFTKLGDEYVLITDEDDDIAQMTTIENGKCVRLYFTECALLPPVPVDYTFHVARVTLGDFVTSTTPATQGGN